MASYKAKGWKERLQVRRSMRVLQKRAAFLQGIVEGSKGEPSTTDLLEHFRLVRKALKKVIRAIKAQKEEEDNR